MGLLDWFKVGNDAIYMEVNKGLPAFGAEEEGAVEGVVHEEVCSVDSMLQPIPIIAPRVKQNYLGLQ